MNDRHYLDLSDNDNKKSGMTSDSDLDLDLDKFIVRGLNVKGNNNNINIYKNDFSSSMSDSEHSESDSYDDDKPLKKTKKSISDKVDELAAQAIKNQKSAILREGLRPIHPDIKCWYNSLNVFVGRQGTGKTYSAMKEIAKIAMVSKETCQVLYITKDGTKCDQTVEALKGIIDIPFIYIKEDEAEERVKRLNDWMEFYKGIQDGQIDPWNLVPEQVQEMFEVLHIEDWDAPFLHIIILFEDFVNNKLVKKPDSFFMNFIATLRHKGFSVFICIQMWKGLPVPLKSNATTVFIFAGFSRQQLYHILFQIPLADKDEVVAMYKSISGNQKLIVNAVSQTVTISN
jgi:hypothetical protein